MGTAILDVRAGRHGLLAALRVLGITVLLAVVLSLAILPFLGMPWWKVLRRCASVAAALSIVWSIRFKEKRSFASYGLDWSADARKDLWLGLCAGSVGLAVLLCFGFLSGSYHISFTPDRWKLWRVLTTFVPVALVVGILEEIFFRGYLFGNLKSVSTKMGIVLSSALYSVVHLKVVEFHPSVGRELIGLFLLGAILCLSTLWTRRLWLAIGLHAVLAYGARVNKLVLEISPLDHTWLTGTSRLINGVAGWVSLILVALAIGLVLNRRGRVGQA